MEQNNVIPMGEVPMMEADGAGVVSDFFRDTLVIAVPKTAAIAVVAACAGVMGTMLTQKGVSIYKRAIAEVEKEEAEKETPPEENKKK